MGILDFAKGILIANAERRGFNDGREGNATPIEFCEPFPQDSVLARAYKKGRQEGREASVPQTLGKVNKVLDKLGS